MIGATRPGSPGAPGQGEDGGSGASPPVTMRGAARFFLPLIFMTELNMISKSVIHAFIARMASPSVSLAGFNVAFTFYFSITSATEVSNLLTLAFLRDRRGILRLLGFFCLLVGPFWLLAQAVAFTSLGDRVYGGLFGASEAAAAEARLATFVLSLSAPILMLRALSFGLLMLNRRTVFITWSTLVRLASLAVSLVVLPRYLGGAAAGAAALVACMAVETLVSWALAARYFLALPPRLGRPPAIGELWRFSWPLILNQSAEMGMVFVINVCLGRLASPDLALAAFGVVHGLVSLIMSPLRNLMHTAQTLARTPADARVLARFAWLLVGGFALLALALFETPLRALVLGQVMGLAGALQSYAEPAVRLAFLMSAFWGLSALYRGLTAGRRETRVLAATGVLRIAVAGVIASIAFVASEVNGAVLGLLAWIGGYGSEALLLRGTLRSLLEAGERGSKGG